MIEAVWSALYGESLATKKRSAPDQVRVLCIFHPDHDPSLDIHLRKDVFFCRTCNAKGGYLDLIVKAGFANDRREAAKWIERRGIR